MIIKYSLCYEFSARFMFINLSVSAILATMHDIILRSIYSNVYARVNEKNFALKYLMLRIMLYGESEKLLLNFQTLPISLINKLIVVCCENIAFFKNTMK